MLNLESINPSKVIAIEGNLTELPKGKMIIDHVMQMIKNNASQKKVKDYFGKHAEAIFCYFHEQHLAMLANKPGDFSQLYHNLKKFFKYLLIGQTYFKRDEYELYLNPMKGMVNIQRFTWAKIFSRNNTNAQNCFIQSLIEEFADFHQNYFVRYQIEGHIEEMIKHAKTQAFAQKEMFELLIDCFPDKMMQEQPEEVDRLFSYMNLYQNPDKFIREFPAELINLSALHGTNSHAFQSIVDLKGIYPTGQLLAANVKLKTGELREGVQGINCYGISTTDLQNFSIAVKYAKTKSVKEPVDIENFDKLLELINRCTLDIQERLSDPNRSVPSYLASGQGGYVFNETLNEFMFALPRLSTIYDKTEEGYHQFEEKLQLIRDEFKKLIPFYENLLKQFYTNSEAKKFLIKINNMMEKIYAAVSEENREKRQYDFFKAEESLPLFPIVLGSTNVTREPVFYTRLMEGEKATDSLKLQKHIQVIFTEKEYIETLRESLSLQGIDNIHVYSFSDLEAACQIYSLVERKAKDILDLEPQEKPIEIPSTIPIWNLRDSKNLENYYQFIDVHVKRWMRYLGQE